MFEEVLVHASNQKQPAIHPSPPLPSPKDHLSAVSTSRRHSPIRGFPPSRVFYAVGSPGARNHTLITLNQQPSLSSNPYDGATAEKGACHRRRSSIKTAPIERPALQATGSSAAALPRCWSDPPDRQSPCLGKPIAMAFPSPWRSRHGGCGPLNHLHLPSPSHSFSSLPLPVLTPLICPNRGAKLRVQTFFHSQFLSSSMKNHLEWLD